MRDEGSKDDYCLGSESARKPELRCVVVVVRNTCTCTSCRCSGLRLRLLLLRLLLLRVSPLVPRGGGGSGDGGDGGGDEVDDELGRTGL